MTIKLIGACCGIYQSLIKNISEALRQLDMEAKIEKTTNVEEIMKYGVINFPAVIINDKVVFSEYIPTVKEIKDALSKKG